MFTQAKSGYFYNGIVYWKKWDLEKVFTIKVFTNQGCSLTEVSMYLIEEISCHLSLFVATPPFLSASPPVRPSRQQPAVYRHVITHHIHVNVILQQISRHGLPNADSYLLVVRTCYNGQCKQIPHVRWSFKSEIADTYILK